MNLPLEIKIKPFELDLPKIARKVIDTLRKTPSERVDLVFQDNGFKAEVYASRWITPLKLVELCLSLEEGGYSPNACSYNRGESRIKIEGLNTTI